MASLANGSVKPPEYDEEPWADVMHENMLQAHLKAEAIEEQEMKQFIQDYKNLISVIQSMKPKLYRKGTRKKAHNFINGFTMDDWHDLEQKKVAIYKEALNECNEAYDGMIQTAIEQHGFKMRKVIEAEMLSETPDIPKEEARRESGKQYRAQITKEMKKAMTARSKSRHALQTAEYHFALSYLLDQNSDKGKQFQAAHQKMSEACRDVHAMIVEYELERLPDDGKKQNKQKQMDEIPNNFEKKFAVGRRTSAARPTNTRTDAKPGWMHNLGM